MPTTNELPSAPITGTDDSGPGVTGQSNLGPGVSGESLGLSRSGFSGSQPASDGVLGTGNNGVHGVSSGANGVLGENSGSGCGVSGTSAAGDGVYGVNGAGSGTTPTYGCGVRGESESGYGLYGASKTSAGIYATSAEFAGNVSITGDVTMTGKFDGGSASAVHGVNGAGSGTTPQHACGVWGESADGYGLYGASKSSVGLYATSGEFGGNVSVTGNFSVTGDASFKGNFSHTGDASITGKLTAVDVILSGADCAEEFDIAGSELEPGTVAVLDNGGALGACATAYDKRVAGVVSGAGEFRPGVILDRRISSGKRAPIALVGKVYCKVDASYAAIEVGDLLTTSSTTGCAMKAADPMKAFGAVIGKALAPHSKGQALIPILVSLQ